MRPRSVIAFAVAAVLAVAAPAAAQGPTAGAWSVTFGVGLDNSWSGDFNNRAQGTLQTQPVQVSARTYANAFGPGVSWAVAIGRGMSDRTELRIRVSGYHLQGDRKQTGRVGIEDLAGTLFSNPDNYQEVAGDVGWRLYFRPGAGIQPYIGAEVGFARVSEMGVALDVPDAVFTFQQNLGLYSGSSAVTFGGHAGLLFNTSESFGFYVDADMRFRSGLKENDGDLTGTNLEGLNNDSLRWNLPLSVGVRLGF